MPLKAETQKAYNSKGRIQKAEKRKRPKTHKAKQYSLQKLCQSQNLCWLKFLAFLRLPYFDTFWENLLNHEYWHISVQLLLMNQENDLKIIVNCFFFLEFFEKKIRRISIKTFRWLWLSCLKSIFRIKKLIWSFDFMPDKSQLIFRLIFLAYFFFRRCLILALL